uniref:Uncharacterized protein n=1 Tax=Clastoptera arizonana TaxID=38151 RepID=A0A1B6D9S3_9HEMI
MFTLLFMCLVFLNLDTSTSKRNKEPLKLEEPIWSKLYDLDKNTTFITKPALKAIFRSSTSREERYDLCVTIARAEQKVLLLAKKMWDCNRQEYKDTFTDPIYTNVTEVCEEVDDLENRKTGDVDNRIAWVKRILLRINEIKMEFLLREDIIMFHDYKSLLEDLY